MCPYISVRIVSSFLNVPYISVRIVSSFLNVPYISVRIVSSFLNVPYTSVRIGNSFLTAPYISVRIVSSFLTVPYISVRIVSSFLTVPYISVRILSSLFSNVVHFGTDDDEQLPRKYMQIFFSPLHQSIVCVACDAEVSTDVRGAGRMYGHAVPWGERRVTTCAFFWGEFQAV